MLSRIKILFCSLLYSVEYVPPYWLFYQFTVCLSIYQSTKGSTGYGDGTSFFQHFDKKPEQGAVRKKELLFSHFEPNLIENIGKYNRSEIN